MQNLQTVRKYKLEATRALVLARELVAVLECRQIPPSPTDTEDGDFYSDVADRLDVLKSHVENG